MGKIMKKSEARILLYLENADPIFCFTYYISHKLGMDYIYLVRLLKSMCLRRWVLKHKRSNKAFYRLSSSAPLTTAKKIMEG